MQWVQLLIGGAGIAGIGGLLATLYLLRANRDDTLARAARSLVEGSAGYTEDLREDLNAAREELHQARAEIARLTEQIHELAAEVQGVTEQMVALRLERDRAIEDRDRALARVAEVHAELRSRRRTDPTEGPGKA